jgi:hypothetical protein
MRELDEPMRSPQVILSEAKNLAFLRSAAYAIR